MIRVRDAEDPAYHGLRALAWRPYLTAMWILCGELRSMYQDQCTEADGPLMAATMDMVRDLLTGRDPVTVAGRAADLDQAWKPLHAAAPRGTPTGILQARLTFANLARDVAEGNERRNAAEWVTQAAAERWRVRDPSHRGARRIDPDEEAADDSPMAQTLVMFGRIVARVGDLRGPEWDPAPIRAQIFAAP